MTEPTKEMIDRGVAFALSVKLGGDYTWDRYIADLYCEMEKVRAKPDTVRQLEVMEQTLDVLGRSFRAHPTSDMRNEWQALAWEVRHQLAKADDRDALASKSHDVAREVIAEDDARGGKVVKAKYIEVQAEVRYWEDATINGQDDTDGSLVPFRNGEFWVPKIRLEDGWIVNWPARMTAYIHYKVCDQGQYWLADDSGRIAKWRGDYVPDDFLCHGCTGHGDYIIFAVGPDGSIKDWKTPTVNADEWVAMSAEVGS